MERTIVWKKVDRVITLSGTNVFFAPISMRLCILEFFGALISCKTFDIQNGRRIMTDAKIQIQPITVKLGI